MSNIGASKEPPAPAQTEPDCLRCRHFYITWASSHPYGCRLMGFVSRQKPSREVFREDGSPGLAFEARAPRPEKQPARACGVVNTRA